MAYFPYVTFVSVVSFNDVTIPAFCFCLPLKLYLNSLVYHRNIFGSSSKVFGNHRKSSDIFGNFRKFSENVRERSSGLRNNFGNLRKSSEGGRKSSENHQKRRHQLKIHHLHSLITTSYLLIFSCHGQRHFKAKIRFE